MLKFITFSVLVLSEGILGVATSIGNNNQGSMTIFKHNMRFSGDANVIEESVAVGLRMAFEQCRQMTKWQRWNCPHSHFFQKNKAPTPESAFIDSLSAASITYQIIRNCLNGQISQCSSNLSLYSRSMRKRILTTSANYGCTGSTRREIMKLARETIFTYLNPTAKKKRRGFSVEELNYNIGIRIMRKALKSECSINGRNFLYKPFPQFAQRIYTIWRKSISGISRFSIGKFGGNQLAFLEPSPGYCRSNVTTKVPGTNGRTCMRKSYEDQRQPLEDSRCVTLCFSCGYLVDTKMTLERNKCRCTIDGCCNLKCEECVTRVITYYCTSARKH